MDVFDATTWGSAIVALAALTALACFVPARGATRVDPMQVLREE